MSLTLTLAAAASKAAAQVVSYNSRQHTFYLFLMWITRLLFLHHSSIVDCTLGCTVLQIHEVKYSTIFLPGKFNKVLLSNMKFPVIPRRIKISKRLAQCMHPALPSGVHLKALETYDIIFKCMGTNRLSHELFIYSAGISFQFLWKF